MAFELAAEWALAGPDGPGGGLGDDGVFGVAVVLVEGAAFDDALPDGGEVVGADPAVVGEGGVVGTIDGDDAVDPAFAGRGACELTREADWTPGRARSFSRTPSSKLARSLSSEKVLPCR